MQAYLYGARVIALEGNFDDAFGVKRRKTLAINCLPMGVGFSSEFVSDIGYPFTCWERLGVQKTQ